MISTVLLSHIEFIGSFDVNYFGGRLEDYLTGENEEEENAVPSATERSS